MNKQINKQLITVNNYNLSINQSIKIIFFEYFFSYSPGCPSIYVYIYRANYSVGESYF